MPSADARLGRRGLRRRRRGRRCLDAAGPDGRLAATGPSSCPSRPAGRLPASSARAADSLGQLDEHVAAGFLERDVAGGGELLREVAEAAGAVGALGERRVELQQRALEQPELRRHLAIGQHLQRAPHERHRLLDRRGLRRGGGRAALAAAVLRPARPDQVLVGDELVAVALHHEARERAAADDEDLLVVLLQLLDEGDEVAVAADDDVGVDVAVGERHLERVEREVDVGAVLVAARREVALHQLGRVLRQRSAVVAGARPVAVGDLGHDVAALLERLEDDADVELHAQRALDADLDVVEIDEYCNLQSCVCQNVLYFPSWPPEAHGHYGSNREPSGFMGSWGSGVQVGFRFRVRFRRFGVAETAICRGSAAILRPLSRADALSLYLSVHIEGVDRCPDRG